MPTRKKKTAPVRRAESAKRALYFEPVSALQGHHFNIRGIGWDVIPLAVEINAKRVRPQRILLGVPVDDGFRPAPTGEFVLEMSTRDLTIGRHAVRIVASCGPSLGRESAIVEVKSAAVPQPPQRGETQDARRRREVKDAGGGGPLLRRLDWFRRRFGHLGFIPDGVRKTQLDAMRTLRRHAQKLPEGAADIAGQPVPGSCNWTPVGPGPVLVNSATAFSGRAISIAFDPVDSDIIYVGAANGGLWKSTDRGLTWSPKSDYQNSLAIGTIAIDPNDRLRVFAGTGQYGDAVGTFYGNGILFSANGGNSWSELATTTFLRDEISKILFDATDATSQRLFLTSRQGVWESIDAGVNWTLLRAGAASDVVQIVSGSNVRLIVGVHSVGLYTATRTAGVWSAWTQYATANPVDPFQRIVLAQSRSNPSTVYAAFSDGYNIAGMARTTDAGTTWTPVTPPLSTDVNATSLSAGTTPHTHTVLLTAAAMTAATLTYATSGPSAGAAHTHTITLTAAQLANVRNGVALVTVTTSVDSGHSHAITLNRRPSRQTWYNFCLVVHPTNTNIVYYGEVFFWKTTTGTGPWTQLSPPHTDHHALALAPNDADEVWVAGDGGVYRSPDAGTTFQHRNRDLQTLEYISIAQHPQWETIMIGGTQDNGTHRFTGSPVWDFVDGGDGGYTAIDASAPARMYHEYIYQYYYRSDTSGASGSWVYKAIPITGFTEFYSPFVLDPSDTDVCYFGADELWRSPDNADTWAAITGTVANTITAIAVHPADSNTIYVGTTSGRVYQAQKTGATWAVADVTTTEITGTGLPANVYISDLAVDAAGNIWLTTSSLLWSETSGEFTNDHVYRRPAGGGAWVSKSTGLAQANPINSIVIDPADSNRLFCGGDLGVFRTDNAGTMWTAWDPGLPNVAVFDLQIHAPRRLLRAATHGRSVWERPIDTASCPMVDLYMRDNILDSGRVQPTPEATHPFDASLWAGHWRSEDIKVDGPEPAFQTATPVNNYVEFAALQHRTARRNLTNRFYVQVHNRGVSAAHNVQVRAFFAATSPGLPPLPADFWTGGRPFSGTPSGLDWTPIGNAVLLGDLEPGEPGIAEWDWMIPNSAPKHSCLLAVATCTEDPITGTGILNPDTLVSNSKHVTLKNLVVENAVPGTAMPPEDAMTAPMHPFSKEDRVADIRINWGTLPRKTRLFFAFSRGDSGKPVISESTARWKRLGIQLSSRYARLFPSSVRDTCGNSVRIDGRNVLVLTNTDRGATTIPGVRLGDGGPVWFAMNLVTPPGSSGTREFDVMRVTGRRIVGGVTYQLRLEKG
jgi:photosystem II stability/assembly factor-like uncharacterized protein